MFQSDWKKGAPIALFFHFRPMSSPVFRRFFFLAAILSLYLWASPVFGQSELAATSGSAVVAGNFVQQIDPQSQVITWDGQTGIAVNNLVGADTFYNLGVWGQATVTANVEAGLVWNGHETTSTVSDFYVAPGASGEVDQHATWVGSVLAGYNPNADPNNYPYVELGMAPLTQLSSGAIATGWYNATDPSTGQQNTYFDITSKTFYSAYNNYFTNTPTHNMPLGGGISLQFSAPTDVINSSWGYGDPTGQVAYTMAAAGLARANANTTLVIAAGNATTVSNPSNNVNGPASGYNSISVGAVGNGTATQFNTVAEFSSRGPQDYYDPVHGVVQGVRAPVDLVAPGTTIAAAYYGGQTGGNGLGLSTTQPDIYGGATNLYNTGLAGTSFASPIVAGGVSLLKSVSYLTGMGDESRDTRVIKAVLMNSATKLTGWDNGQHLNGSGVTVTTQALDWAQGAGMLNLNKAFSQYYSGTQDVAGTGGGSIQRLGWDFGTIAKSAVAGQVNHNDYAMNFTLQGTAVLDVTLAWFRNVSLPVFGDNADPELQTLTTQDLGMANLNVEIWNANFTHLYASSESKYSTVQELHYTLPADGEYGIRVTYADQMFGDPVPEDYGLSWNVDDVQVVPEPGVYALLVVACLTIALYQRATIRKGRLSVRAVRS